MTTEQGLRRRASGKFDSPQQEVYLNLWRTYDRLRILEDELFGQHDLTAQQYNTLRVLRGAHPSTIPTLTLASRLVSRAPDITRLLDKLHDRDLVQRERPADNRRTVQIGITEAGIRLLDQIADQVKACHVQQLGHLSSIEMQQLVELLRKARERHEPEESYWK